MYLAIPHSCNGVHCILVETFKRSGRVCLKERQRPGSTSNTLVLVGERGEGPFQWLMMGTPYYNQLSLTMGRYQVFSGCVSIQGFGQP